MKILNLYAGIGGNRKLWGDEHEITAVEYKQDIADVYKELYPNDTMIVTDAHQYLIDHYMEYDFIWTSPPCPTHSRARYGLGFHGGKNVAAVYPDMRLYQEIILLKHYFKGKYAVENVQAFYKPLIEPFSIGRHWYWSNFTIGGIKIPYIGMTGITTLNGKRLQAKNVTELQDHLGIDLTPFNVRNKRLLLRNAVEPKVGLHILNESLRNIYIFNELEQESLF